MTLLEKLPDLKNHTITVDNRNYASCKDLSRVEHLVLNYVRIRDGRIETRLAKINGGLFTFRIKLDCENRILESSANLTPVKVKKVTAWQVVPVSMIKDMKTKIL